MHAVHPHLSRAVIVTLLAAVAALAISLVLAARLGDVQLSAGSSAAGSSVVSPRAAARVAPPRAPAWLNPFAPFVSGPIELPWPRAGTSGS